MTYEAWRISYQSSEQAARAAYQRAAQLAAALQPFAEAFEATGVQSYAGMKPELVAFLDRNELTPAQGLTMQQFRQAWEVLTGQRAVDHHTGEQDPAP